MVNDVDSTARKGSLVARLLFNKVAFVISLIVVFGFVAILNILSPLVADDFSTAWNAPRNDVFSIFAIYGWAGGCLTSYLFSYLSFRLPEWGFDIVNALVYLSLVFAVYKFCATRRKNDTFLFLLINFLFWAFTADYGQVFFWQIGATAYMWPMAVSLWFLYPLYRFATTGKNFRHGGRMIPVLLIGGFLAGCAGAPSAGTSLLACLLFIWWSYLKQHKVPLWMAFSFVGTLAGFITFIVAPGNYARAADYVDDRSMMVQLVARFEDCTEILLNSSFWLVVLIIVGTLLHYYLGDRKVTKELLFFPLIGFAGVYCLMLAPTGSANAGRAFFPGITYLILACAITLSALAVIKDKYLKSGYAITATLLALNFFSSVAPAIQNIGEYYLANTYRDRVVQAQKADGLTEIVVPALPGPVNRYQESYADIYNITDLTDDTTFWANTTYATLHEIGTIKTVSDEEWKTNPYSKTVK